MLKKIVAIHDLSGMGKCSLTAAIPILSALKLQCCPFPTAILSNQTCYPKFSFLDLTSEMSTYKKVWSDLNFKFDCIYSGFLGSEKQVEIVCDFIKDNKNIFVVVDPVMGDDGEIYPVFDKNMCLKIKSLVKSAHLVTPNLTEALILLDEDYTCTDLDLDDIVKLAKRISNLGPNKVIITGIVKEDKIINLAYDKYFDKNYITESSFNNISYSGTGDIFTSIVTGMIIRGYELQDSIEKASDFIHKTVTYTS
ncbi:MAG: pyridoxamine kinase, partial [Paraclostridium sp.]